MADTKVNLSLEYESTTFNEAPDADGVYYPLAIAAIVVIVINILAAVTGCCFCCGNWWIKESHSKTYQYTSERGKNGATLGTLPTVVPPMKAIFSDESCKKLKTMEKHCGSVMLPKASFPSHYRTSQVGAKEEARSASINNPYKMYDSKTIPECVKGQVSRNSKISPVDRVELDAIQSYSKLNILPTNLENKPEDKPQTPSSAGMTTRANKIDRIRRSIDLMNKLDRKMTILSGESAKVSSIVFSKRYSLLTQ